jgi:hypothetical protein
MMVRTLKEKQEKNKDYDKMQLESKRAGEQRRKMAEGTRR